MTRNELTVLKMNLLGGMDTYIRNLNDENAMEPWLMDGVPDEADEDILRFIAENAADFAEVCALFGRIVKRYVKSDDDEYTEEVK